MNNRVYNNENNFCHRQDKRGNGEAVVRRFTMAVKRPRGQYFNQAVLMVPVSGRRTGIFFLTMMTARGKMPGFYEYVKYNSLACAFTVIRQLERQYSLYRVD